MFRAPAQHNSHRSSPRRRHPDALGKIGGREQLRTPSFGKCLAQSVFRLVDGSELVLSTGRILMASDWYCDGQGLTPDIRLEQAEADDTDDLMARYAR